MSPALELQADCSRCAALCCVLPAFVKSVDFAIDKPAGQPCRHVRADHRCGIHDRLRPAGFRGCVVFDCFGAGQRIVSEVPGAEQWRTDRTVIATLQELLPRVRRTHELLWHLDEVLDRGVTPQVRAEAQSLHTSLRRLPVDPDAVELATFLRRGVDLLGRASRQIRADGSGRTPERRGANLLGRDLRRTPVARADLRNATLIAADLRGTRFDRTDLLGADLRDADLRGADLRTALFVTQPQVDSAAGDVSTRLPARLHRPVHW